MKEEEEKKIRERECSAFCLRIGAVESVENCEHGEESGESRRGT
jgi:hypothetical protein